jgi:flagellar biogenesis protein FliO
MNTTATTSSALSEKAVYSMSLWVFGLGALIVVLVIVFALALLLWRRREGDFLERYFREWLHGPVERREVVYLSAMVGAAYAEHLARRNEFWVTYGQTTVAVLLLIVVTVLLLTRTINPDAGLPILSGIGGFAIAKTTGSSRGVPSAPPEGRENRG